MSVQEMYLFYTDYNCPFCYALNERVRTIGRSQQIMWRGVEHLPGTISSCTSLDDSAQIVAEVSMIRKRAPEITLIAPEFRPNTKLANRLTLLAEQQDASRVADLRTLIYRAYWQQGQDISDVNVLKSLCQQLEMQFPVELETSSSHLKAIDNLLDQWQSEWEGERFKTRMPILVSVQADKPLLGFPTLNLLIEFFEGNTDYTGPETLASCYAKEKQNILVVSPKLQQYFSMVELRAAFQIIEVVSVELAKQWLSAEECFPDLILIDQKSLQQEALDFCIALRQQQEYRHSSIIIIQDKTTSDAELAAFDAGATDVIFDLSNPKICQARIESILRAKKSTALLSDLARMDYLTQLPNRLEYDLKIEDVWLHARRMQSPVSLIFIDVDHFKVYNDTYGHSVGDDCLRQIATAMKGCIKRPTDILARYGGEEFVVILRDTPIDGAFYIAQQLNKAVEALALPHISSQTSDVVTISLGVACQIPDMKASPQQLANHADEALYRAKSNGRNRVEYFQPEKGDEYE